MIILCFLYLTPKYWFQNIQQEPEIFDSYLKVHITQNIESPASYFSYHNNTWVPIFCPQECFIAPENVPLYSPGSESCREEEELY